MSYVPKKNRTQTYENCTQNVKLVRTIPKHLYKTHLNQVQRLWESQKRVAQSYWKERVSGTSARSPPSKNHLARVVGSRKVNPVDPPPSMRMLESGQQTWNCKIELVNTRHCILGQTTQLPAGRVQRRIVRLIGQNRSPSLQLIPQKYAIEPAKASFVGRITVQYILTNVR